MTAVLVEAMRLTKTWPGGGGLAPVDLVVSAGDLIVVRGRSGSGKSTLLSLLAGWCRPDGGELRWRGGIPYETWDGVAVVPQVLGLAPELSIAENVDLPLRLAGVARRERRRRVAAALDELDLTELGDRLPRETSLGQRQRTAVARAMVSRPAIALVDEPSSHQDGTHTESIVGCLRTATTRGTAVIVATHDEPVVAAARSVLDLDPPG